MSNREGLPIETAPTSRKCTACGEVLPLDYFYRAAAGKLGRRSRCKGCYEMNRNRVVAAEAQRRYVRRHPDRRRAVERASQLNNSENKAARRQVRLAVSGGRLHRPSHCGECGAEGPVEGHHEDYSKPLDVLWLCAPCHLNRHGKEVRA